MFNFMQTITQYNILEKMLEIIEFTLIIEISEMSLNFGNDV